MINALTMAGVGPYAKEMRENAARQASDAASMAAYRETMGKAAQVNALSGVLADLFPLTFGKERSPEDQARFDALRKKVFDILGIEVDETRKPDGGGSGKASGDVFGIGAATDDYIEGRDAKRKSDKERFSRGVEEFKRAAQPGHSGLGTPFGGGLPTVLGSPGPTAYSGPPVVMSPGTVFAGPSWLPPLNLFGASKPEVPKNAGQVLPLAPTTALPPIPQQPPVLTPEETIRRILEGAVQIPPQGGQWRTY